MNGPSTRYQRGIKMKWRLFYIGLGLLTGAVYLAMVLWSLPEIMAEADGLKPFDLRPFGYSPRAAELFLDALSEEGRVFYGETQHALDTLFPALLAIWGSWTAALLFRGPVAWALIAAAGLGCGADYAENAAVAGLLQGFDAGLAIEASRWTLVKSASVTVLLGGLLWGFVRRLRGARR